MKYILLSVIFLTGCGVHYNCDIKSIPPDNTKEQIEWFEYCSVDPMQDFTKNKWGQTRDWKDGQWK